MKPKTPRVLWTFALLMLLAASSAAPAASLGVRDDAKFFSPAAVSQAEQTIRQINQKHHRDVLVETIASVPADQQDQLQQLGKTKFFQNWADQRALQQGVRGVYILICRQPSHLQVAAGNVTEAHQFTVADRDELSRMLLASFKQEDFDGGLIQGVNFIQQRMDANAPASGSGAAAAQTGTGTSAPLPSGNTGQTNYPSVPHGQTSWGLGGIACAIIGVIVIIMLIRGVMGRAGGGYGRPGGYYPPGGGGGYPQGGGYPPQGGGYGYGGGGGGGSGFGRGFLGGLLGGAVGGYAADKWMHGQQQGGGAVPPTGAGGGAFDPGNQADTSFNSTGGDFGSPDAGSGGGGGGDFGGGGDTGGGGGDFGGGGGDSGGGGGGGGDF